MTFELKSEGAWERKSVLVRENSKGKDPVMAEFMKRMRGNISIFFFLN